MGVDNYQDEEYGGKLVIRGDEEETYAYINNVEFTKCGQPQLYNQGCVTLMVSGQADDIQFENNSIHHSYGRGLQINRGRQQLIKRNVLYDVAGHNIHLTGMFSRVRLI